MVEIVCQRCGAKGSGENLVVLKLGLKHEKGCGRRIGITVVTSKAKPMTDTSSFTATTGTSNENIVLDEAKPTAKPKSKKSKRKKKSDS